MGLQRFIMHLLRVKLVAVWLQHYDQRGHALPWHDIAKEICQLWLVFIFFKKFPKNNISFVLKIRSKTRHEILWSATAGWIQLCWVWRLWSAGAASHTSRVKRRAPSTLPCPTPPTSPIYSPCLYSALSYLWWSWCSVISLLTARSAQKKHKQMTRSLIC